MKLKELFLILLIIISLLIVIGTAFLPIILSIINANWLYMALYFIIWGIVWFEVAILSLILRFFIELFE